MCSTLNTHAITNLTHTHTHIISISCSLSRVFFITSGPAIMSQTNTHTLHTFSFLPSCLIRCVHVLERLVLLHPTQTEAHTKVNEVEVPWWCVALEHVSTYCMYLEFWVWVLQCFVLVPVFVVITRGVNVMFHVMMLLFIPGYLDNIHFT